MDSSYSEISQKQSIDISLQHQQLPPLKLMNNIVKVINKSEPLARMGEVKLNYSESINQVLKDI